MSVETGEERTCLEVGELHNIKYEEVEKFRTSVLYEAYQEANSITKEIIEDNKRLHAQKGGRTSGTEIRNLEQIYNIIFFTGSRGTGKTSSMLSYMEFLKDYYRISSSVRKGTDAEEFLLDDGKDYMFTGLEYIDASSLDEKEDILGSVLSKMLSKWREEEERSFNGKGILRNEDYAYKKRQICMRFSKVYEHLKNLRSKSDITEADSDAFMETLEKLSLTWNLQRAFQELVLDFLDIMEYPGAEKKIGRDNHFLVISIDDLDMNIKHGFRLMEQIRKYFMGPNIIVLMSADYEQLEKICYNHYIAEFEKMKDFGDTREYVMSLSREYLEKIVPPQRQIVLQSGNKWRFFSGKKIEVQFDGQKSSINGTLEEIIQDDMRRYFGAHFLLGGKCLYYLTPDTLRELCTWINRTRRLADQIKDMEDQKKNFRWFWDEEFPLLCKRYMSASDDKVFKAADLLEPVGQIRFMKESLRKEGRLKEGEEEQSLLQIIAELSQGTMREQTFVSMMSIYFTMKLAEIMSGRKWLTGENRQQAIERFYQHFADGLWGKWEKKMIKPLSEKRGNEIVLTPIGYYTFTKRNSLLNALLKGNDGDLDNFIRANRDTLINYQLVLLFYQVSVEQGVDTKKLWKLDGERHLVMDGEFSGLFCLSNPFINLVDQNCLARKFVEALPDILSQRIKEDQREKIAAKIRRYVSIFDDYRTVDPIIPLDSVDFLVETGKVIMSKLGEEKIEMKSEDVMNRKIQAFFAIIGSRLVRYDKEYAERYYAYPLIRRILGGDQEFLAMLRKSISISTVPSPMYKEEEWSK